MDFKNLSKLNNLSNLIEFNNLSKLFGGTDKTTAVTETVLPKTPEVSTIPDEKTPQLVISDGTTIVPPTLPKLSIKPTPSKIVIPDQPAQPVSPKVESTQKIILIFMGLPGCGKTAISREILNKLKASKGLKTRFIEGRMNEISGDEDYLGEIIKAINSNYDVIITNGQNYIKSIRVEIVKLSQLFKNKYKVLFVDFVHSKDSPNSFDKFKSYCVQITSNRTDSYKQHFQLSDIIRKYEAFNDSTDPKSYIKLNIDDKFYVNSKKIIDAINKL